MVQILESPFAGIAQGLGAGLSKGLEKGFERARHEKLVEKIRRQRQPTIAEQLAPKDQQKLDQQFIDVIQDYENKTGQQLQPQQLDELWKSFSQPKQTQPDYWQEAEMFAAAGMPTEAKISTERAKAAQKEKFAHEAAVEKSYEKHKDFTDRIRSEYEGFEAGMKPRLLQMQSLNNEELISPMGAKLFEELGIPLGVLDDPSSQLFQKVSQDLLKGLPETYGNRILKVEVDNFLKTIPTLMNSPEGRRMVASNMLKLGEMKKVYYDEMRRMQHSYMDEGRKLPPDFEERIFDNVIPQINRINQEFVQMASVKEIPEGTVPFFNNQGTISFVPKNAVEWAEKNGGRRIW